MPGALKVYINLYYVTSFLLIVFSGFYLTRLIPVSPVYLCFILGIICVFAAIFFKRRVKYIGIIVTPYYFILYLCLTQVFLGPMIGTFINVFFSLLYLVFMPIVLPGLTRSQVIRIAVYFIRFSVILLGIEGIYRLTHPIFQVEGSTVDYSNSEDLVFYAYKMNSIMFQDSNFVGLYGLAIFFLAHYINRFHTKINKLWMVILAGLIAGTLSRAAIISMALTLILVWILGYKLQVKRILILLILGLLFTGFAVSQFINDPSLQSKFHIIELTQQYLEKASLFNLLFGVGLGNTKQYLNIGAHNFFVAYLIESGIFGLILQVSIIIELFLKSKTKAWPVILSFLIAGLSLAGHAVSFLYAAIFLIICLEKQLQLETAKQSIDKTLRA